LEAQLREAYADLLPQEEARPPRRRPLRFVGDLLTGPDDLERRRAERGE
jgi:hypothetical protein